MESENCPNIFITSPASISTGGVVAHSHANEPLSDDGIRGRSRAWGDASEEVQRRTVSEILRQGREMGWSEQDLGFALAVARVESGFNPDAAASSTSASGVGQFIDKTGSAFGLNSKNRFELRPAVTALLKHLGEILSTGTVKAQPKVDGYSLGYALYHDGPSLTHGGEGIARAEILPKLATFGQWIRSGCSP